MELILNSIYGLLAFVFKLLIGGTISYILPSLCIEDIENTSHYKISIIGILSAAIFSISFGDDSLIHTFLGGMVLIGLIAYVLSEKLKELEKIILFSCMIISIIVGMGYIFQGIILSFLVYYLTFNRVDLFSIFKNENKNTKEDGNNDNNN